MTDKTDKPNITQAMIDAYDEYTHLSLDRRKFMERLTVLAGSVPLRLPLPPCGSQWCAGGHGCCGR